MRRLKFPPAFFRTMHVIVEKTGRIQNEPYFASRSGKVCCLLEGYLVQQIDRGRAGPAEADHVPEIRPCLQAFDQSTANATAATKHNSNATLGKRDI